jgi:hypothetical protein
VVLAIIIMNGGLQHHGGVTGSALFFKPSAMAQLSLMTQQ